MQTTLIPPAPIPPRRPSTWRFLRSLRRDVLSTFAEESYQRLTIRGSILGTPFLLVNDPAGIRRVLVDNAFNYVKPPSAVRVVSPFTGNGLLLAEGDAWRGQRRRVAHAFTPTHVRALVPLFAAASEDLVRRLEAGDPLDPDAFQAVALDAVLRALFSDATPARRVRLQDLVRRYLTDHGGPGRLRVDDLLARDPASFGFLLGGRRCFQREWFAEVDAVVAERRRAPRDGNDLLDRLLAARDAETGEPIADGEIRSQVATFIVAGFETTARLLFWATYLLALDPAEQDRVAAEIGETAEDALRSSRLRSLLQETLRLYPAVPIITRSAVADDVVAGEQVRAGNRVTVSPWLVHRHRRLWDAPDAFRPERFENRPNAYLTDDSFIPFSKGPRVCIGAGFAMTEATIVLAAVLRRYRLLPAKGRPAMPVAVVSIRPDRPYAFGLVRR